MQTVTPKFTNHNILLPDGTWTIPGKEPLEEHPQVKMMIEHLEALFPVRETRRKVVIADLGPHEGGHAAIFLRMGFHVCLIEARKENVRKPLWLQEKLGATSRQFTVIQSDVRDMEGWKVRFDVIVSSGLLYHLDEPVRALKQWMKMTDHIILSTHYSHPYDEMYDSVFNHPRLMKAICKLFPRMFKRNHYGLGRLEKNEGVRGRWYWEFNHKADQEKLHLSSWTNTRSFWICLVDLLNVFRNNGWWINNAFSVSRHDAGLFLCDKKRER